MALRLKSVETAPVTKSLAKRFRDMESLKNERDLKSARAKKHVRLISRGHFFTPIWGQCEIGGKVYRGNGNHTSHVLLACMQAHGDGLDEKSEQFCKDFLFSRGGDWTGSNPQDLPEVMEEEFTAIVETFTGDDDSDLVTFFKRYDSPDSARSRVDLLGIYIGGHNDLTDLSRDRVRYALNGVMGAARSSAEDFKMTPEDVDAISKGDIGEALRRPQVREAVRWIVETVPEANLYKNPAGARTWAEVFANYGPMQGERIVERFMTQLELDEEPAAGFLSLLTKPRNRPTVEHLLKKGRTAIKEIAKALPA